VSRTYRSINGRLLEVMFNNDLFLYLYLYRGIKINKSMFFGREIN